MVDVSICVDHLTEPRFTAIARPAMVAAVSARPAVRAGLRHMDTLTVEAVVVVGEMSLRVVAERAACCMRYGSMLMFER